MNFRLSILRNSSRFLCLILKLKETKSNETNVMLQKFDKNNRKSCTQKCFGYTKMRLSEEGGKERKGEERGL